ncbi:unnamed protein product [Closterium sp. Yama58-4]|nr:unnamed protein product [Closterium sp. Yama58-4]
MWRGRERVGNSAARATATDSSLPSVADTDAVPVVALEESSVSTALGTASYVTATCRASEAGAVLEALGREVERAWGKGGGEGSAGRGGGEGSAGGGGGEGSAGGENIPFFGCVVGGGMAHGPWGGEGEIMGEAHAGRIGRSDAHGMGNHGRDDADGEGESENEGEGEALEWEEVVMAAAAEEVIEGVVLLELIEDADHIIREMAAFAPHEEGRQQGGDDAQGMHEAGEVTGELKCGQLSSAASPVTTSAALPAPPFTEPSNSFAESIRAITEGHVAQAEGAVTQRLEAASRRFLGLAEGLQTRLEAPQYKLQGLADSIQERMWPSNETLQGNELLSARGAVSSRGDGVTGGLEGRGEEEREVVVVVCAAVMPGVDVQCFEVQGDSFPDLGGNMAHMVTSNAAHFVVAGTGGPSLPRLLARLHTIFPHSSSQSSVAASSTISHVPGAHLSILVRLPSLFLLSLSPHSPFPCASSPASFPPAPAEQQSSDALQACFTHFIRHLTLPLPPATSLHAPSPPSPTTASAAPNMDMHARAIAPPAPWLRVNNLLAASLQALLNPNATDLAHKQKAAETRSRVVTLNRTEPDVYDARRKKRPRCGHPTRHQSPRRGAAAAGIPQVPPRAPHDLRPLPWRRHAPFLNFPLPLPSSLSLDETREGAGGAGAAAAGDGGDGSRGILKPVLARAREEAVLLAVSGDMPSLMAPSSPPALTPKGSAAVAAAAAAAAVGAGGGGAGGGADSMASPAMRRAQSEKVMRVGDGPSAAAAAAGPAVVEANGKSSVLEIPSEEEPTQAQTAIVEAIMVLIDSLESIFSHNPGNPILLPVSSSLCLSIRAAASSAEGSGVSVAEASPAKGAAEPTVSAESGGAGTSEGKAAVRKRLVSGVQPTGSIHLGNYLGAIKNWIPLQDECDTFLFVVDLHAITLPHDVDDLSRSSCTAAAMYLACGVDPSKATVFVQSHVRAHAELTWLLSCTTPMSWLNKMIQFKEKARKAGEDVGTGLLTYPLLMAADILLYQCDVVPVGEDQRQHLELTRDVAARINNLYGGRKWKKRGGRGGRVFKVPEAMIPPAGARIMSLTDGTSKMSKSAPSDMSRINLLDPPQVIANKIKRCKTDSFTGMEFGNPERPECQNLLSIYQIVTGKTKEEVEQEVGALSWGQFKPLLADALVAHLEPIQKRYEEVTADPAYLDEVLAGGAARANEIADRTLRDTYDALGFMAPPRR